LSSHPEIIGVDEMEFNHDSPSDYIKTLNNHPNVSFKLPTYAHSLPFIKQLSGLRVLWCVRDPRDVVTSMTRLMLRIDQLLYVPWPSHPLGGQREINNCFPVLNNKAKRKLSLHMEKYEQIYRVHPAQRSHADVVYTAGLCWKVKNELITIYRNEQIPFKIVFYEQLISRPRKQIGKILSFAELPWHENVLKHHICHSGKLSGDTDASRPIDSSNTGKWRTVLSSGDLTTVRELCSSAAGRLGYDLS
jgi:hypothetical protein